MCSLSAALLFTKPSMFVHPPPPPGLLLTFLNSILRSPPSQAPLCKIQTDHAPIRQETQPCSGVHLVIAPVGSNLGTILGCVVGPAISHCTNNPVATLARNPHRSQAASGKLRVSGKAVTCRSEAPAVRSLLHHRCFQLPYRRAGEAAACLCCRRCQEYPQGSPPGREETC